MTGYLAAASAAFFLVHLVPSTPLRPRLIASAGEGVYRGIIALPSLIAFGLMISLFARAPYGDKLWVVPGWWPYIQAFLILCAFILIAAGSMTPNPSAPGSAGTKALAQPDPAWGIFAITRHPLMWAVAIWAITHMISQGTWRGLLFFGAFAATALIGSWLQQKRKCVTVPGFAAFEAKTSFWPFVAILDGRARLSLKEIGWRPFVIAAGAWIVILYLHSWLFGVQPIPGIA